MMAYALAALVDICPDCGREWPARFGRHNCNFHRAYVHNRAIVVEPGASLLETLERLTGRLYDEVCSRAESADLAGVESPYPEALGEIDAAIGRLKRFRREVQQLAGHAHKWGSDDYCRICGADGRA